MLEILRKYLTEEELRAGTIVDVGANDGHFLSWSLEMEKEGYHVLCVEGNPEHAELLQARRKDVVIAAVSDKDGEEADFFVWGDLPAPSNTGLIPHTSNYTKSLKVRTRTLTSILEEKSVTNLVFLGIDIEGSEAAALRGLDFSRWAPPLLMVEEHFPYCSEETRSIVLAWGYRRIYASDYDVLYKRA